MDYNDYATLDINKFEQVAKEYKNSINVYKSLNTEDRVSKILDETKKEYGSNLKNKFNYLQDLVQNLKFHIKNENLNIVVQNLCSDIKDYIERYNKLYLENIIIYSEEDNQIVEQFCNNLKLSIQTSLEIIEGLTEVADLEQNSQIKNIINNLVTDMFSFAKKLVSLFGECKYRHY